jgi:hypothetical protein
MYSLNDKIDAALPHVVRKKTIVFQMLICTIPLQMKVNKPMN